MNARYLFPADYMADPAAHVWNGRIWIYPSHDRESGIPERDNGDHFDMVDYHALSIEPDAEGRLDPMTGAVVDHGVILDLAGAPGCVRSRSSRCRNHIKGRWRTPVPPTGVAVP